MLIEVIDEKKGEYKLTVNPMEEKTIRSKIASRFFDSFNYTEVTNSVSFRETLKRLFRGLSPGVLVE